MLQIIIKILYIIEKEGQRFHGGRRQRGEALLTEEDVLGYKEVGDEGGNLKILVASQLDLERASDGGEELGTRRRPAEP